MHFLTLKDFDKGFIEELLNLASEIKVDYSKYKESMANKTLAMIFMKTSTRTRTSFEAGVTKLGGHAIFIESRVSNFALGALKDEAKCISRYTNLIMARVFGHQQVEEIAKASAVPVINGLSEYYHPCQILADLLTIKEKKGSLAGLKLAFVGDGNNVCNSLVVGCSKLGLDVAVAVPKGFEPMEKNAEITYNVEEAVKKADIVYTDTWVSMGQEKETKERMKVFSPFQVNKKLMAKANSDALFMHCLPAHRGLEVSDEVIDSGQSIVFDQAENRMHVQNALMLRLLGGV
ncbi:ornithine carbamoyltransferase [bacterium]|nr:ornithine carbamoyltransferase [bacterium]